MLQDPFERFKIGDTAELSRTITTEDVQVFAELTGDDNPLHMNDAYAATTSFQKRVVHGMLTASFISTMIGTKLPGPGALWFEQFLRFLAPVRIGETVRILATVKQMSPAQRILTLDTIVTGDNQRKVIEGEAKVKLLRPRSEVCGAKGEDVKGAIIVTGASRGIGAAIAEQLAAQGHAVVVNYAHRADLAEAVVLGIRQAGGRALACQADMAKRQEIEGMVATTLKEFGTLDGVVNNACPPPGQFEFLSGSWDAIQVHLDVQIKGAFHLCQAVLPYLTARNEGVIVNLTSIYADNVPPVKLLPYNMAKAALVQLTRSLAAEFGPKGIRINNVAPGMTETDLIANVPEKTKLLTTMQTPLRRLGLPEEIAGVVGFLFSKQARHITGETIRVCGGLVMS